MKASQVMTPATPCSPETNLAAATEILLNEDCGVLPVVDSSQKLLGMITDRDICVALGTRNLRASEMRASDLMGGELHVCRPDQSLSDALTIMAKAKVRRLPVVDHEHRLLGVLSLNDIILSTAGGKQRRDGAPTAEEVLGTMRSICAHRPGKRSEVAA